MKVEKMKILFLDVDGVLNNLNLLEKSGWMAVGENQVDHLKIIIDLTGAEIVLSSTWRLHPDHNHVLRNILSKKGMEIIGETDNFGQFDLRAKEINSWLDEHPEVQKFAILDDNFCAAFWEGIEEKVDLQHSFFQTEFNVGLNEEIRDQIIAHLNSTTLTV